MQNSIFLMKASIASGTIYFGGDVTAQLLVEKKDKIDIERALRFSAIGFAWAGPFCRIGMNRINQVTGKWYTKTALDQSIMMPVNMAMVNILKPLSEGDQSLSEISETWKQKYPEVLTKGWIYWIPATTIIYAFIANETLRFAAFNLAAYIWQVNLAILVNKNKPEATRKPEATIKLEETTKPEVSRKRPEVKRRYSSTSIKLTSFLC